MSELPVYCPPCRTCQQTPGCGAFTWGVNEGRNRCFLKRPTGWISAPDPNLTSGTVPGAAANGAAPPAPGGQTINSPDGMADGATLRVCHGAHSWHGRACVEHTPGMHSAIPTNGSAPRHFAAGGCSAGTAPYPALLVCAAGSCTAEPSTNFRSGDLAVKAGVNSAIDCCALCHRTDACGAWTWGESAGEVRGASR